MTPASAPAPAQNPTARLGARIDRWMTDPRLYRWALRNPVGRWISARRARALFEIMAGFVHSQVLLACVRLRLLEAVLARPRSTQELASLTRIDPESLQKLLDAALSLQLLDKRKGELYGLGALGAPVVAHEGLRAMIEHNALLYADMQDPLALLQAPQNASMHAYWPYAAQESSQRQARQSPDQVARYSALMASSQRFVVEELLASYSFAKHRCVLDVGGGQGGWVCELARQLPALELMLFDLPPVADLAREKVAQAGLAQRIMVHGGSFTENSLPQGADLVTLLRVAHDHSDEVVLVLMQAIFKALAPGGTLLLAEPMAQAAGPATGDAYFHFYLLAMGEGRLRTAAQLLKLMAEAGFVGLSQIHNPMPLHASLLTGKKPV